MSTVAWGERWPESTLSYLTVLEDTGEVATQFQDCTEVVLVGPPNPDRSSLVLPLRFKTLDQGLRAGEILKDAFARVAEIAAENVDHQNCDHEWRLHRFLWKDGPVEVCSLCGLKQTPVLDEARA